MVTRENEYHLRSLLLLHYGGSYITKKIIHRELPKHGGDLDSLLKSHQDSKIKHEFKNRKQLEKLFPLAGQADINKWDVQMLTGTILILFGPKLKYEEKESVRHIKYLRHELAHSPTVAMEEDEYKDFKERLYCAITELASGFEKSVMDDCAQLTKTYESCQLDATSYIEHLNGLKDTDELFEKILEEIKITKQSVCGDIKEAKSEICETVKQTSQVTVDKVTDHIQTSKMDLTNDIAENHKLMLAMIDKLNTMNQWHPFEKHISIVDSKLIFSGDEEAVQMAYTITSTVMNEAIKRTEGSKEKGKIREAVDDILSSFNAINGVKVLSAEMSCIVIKIQCDNYKSLHDLLAHITGNLYKQQLDGLSTALSDGLRKPVTLHSSIPSVCLQTILDEMGNTGMAKHQQLSLPIQCKTSEGVKNVIKLFESDDFSAKLNKLSESLSEEIDKKIYVDAFASNIYLKINNDEVVIDGEYLNDYELVEIKTLGGLPQYDMECEYEPRVDTVSCKKELHARPKDTCIKNKRLIVAAIEIGTTFTTYKYSYETENKSDYLKMEYPAFKTPTVVLFDENDKFHSFGFEAEIKYAELKEKENDIHIQWKIFNDLSLKDQSNLFVVTDEQNRPMLALDVYAAVLGYLKAHLLNSLQYRLDNIDERDIQWIVSVPASWCSKNKELIAEAAEIACFSSACLKFALQTDMTAEYCKEYLVSKGNESRRVENQESLSFGTQIMGTGDSSLVMSTLEEIGTRISGGENSKDFILLYQAKKKADVTDFHIKCDAKGPTLTILYGQHNTIFGGYTSRSWSSNEKRRLKDENAFLFCKNDNISAKCVFLPIKKGKADWAITCDANFGPTFGGGLLSDYDLQTFKKDSKLESEIKDNCMRLNGSLNVNCSYCEKRETGDMGNNPGQEGSQINLERKIKSKDINSGTLLVKTIEVYQVVDDKLEKDWFPKFEGEDFDVKRNEIMEMSPLPGIDVKWYNMLLVGVIGSGKSSFVNTLSALFSRRTVEIAPARDATTSVTCTVKAYILKSERGDPLNIRIFDIRGFEDERGYDHELDLLLNGKLPVGYEFPAMPEPVPVQNQSKPTLNDEMHIVCFINGNPNFETNTKELHTRINDIKKTVAKKGIPMVIVATKFDQLCLKIAKNIDHIYKSPKAKHAAEKIADFYGVPLKHVFPVVNYVSEVETVKEKDRLALKALYEMCQLIKAYLENHPDKTSKPDEWTERSELLQSMETTEQKAVYMRAMNEKLVEFENEKLQVLVVGPTNSGKSSFIDSISSTLKDDLVNTAVGLYAASAQINDASSTEKFQLHEMKSKQDDGTFLRSQVFFGDTPGFQENEGITYDHVKFIMKGNVPNKYKIINGIQETDRDFKADPLPSDRIHCVCIVFDCDSILKGLSENMKRKMQMLLQVLQSEEMEFVVILTKCDLVSAAVKENKRRVFQERKVRECKDRLVEMFMFIKKIIFPVVNYTEENAVDLQSDALLMAAFTEILKIGKNKLDAIEEDVDADNNHE